VEVVENTTFTEWSTWWIRWWRKHPGGSGGSEILLQLVLLKEIHGGIQGIHQ